MTIKITRRKNVLTNQEKSVVIKTNIIFCFKFLVNYKDKRIESYNCSRIVTKNELLTFISKKMIVTEQNYKITKKEMLVII